MLGSLAPEAMANRKGREIGLAGCGKTLQNPVIPAPNKVRRRNLALKINALRDSSSPAAPRNDSLEEFFPQPVRMTKIVHLNVLEDGCGDRSAGPVPTRFETEERRFA